MKLIKIHYNPIYNHYEIKEWRTDKFTSLASGWYTLENAPSFETKEEAEDYLLLRFASSEEYQIEDERK